MATSATQSAINAVKPPTTPPVPITSSPTVTPSPSADTSYSADSPFGKYLQDHPGQGDAYAYLTAVLSEFNLGTLDKFVQDNMVQGRSPDEVVQRMRETPEYKTRFAAIIERQKAGLPAISETDVVNTEKAYTAALQAAGVPKGFYDSPDDFTKMIVNDVSPTEMQDRLTQGYVRAKNDPVFSQQMHQLYGAGMTDGEIAAFYLDPDKTIALIQKQEAATSLASASQRSGFGQLSTGQAESLAGQGITDAQARQGFDQLGQQRDLLTGNASENGNISNDVALNATFGGDAAAKDALDRRRQGRQTDFSGGGTYQTSKNGTTGVGTYEV